MIVTSKRCYLNILTQLWPAERLLNANYYIGDQQAMNGYALINDEVEFNQFGQLIRRNDTKDAVQSFGGKYNIVYSTCLNPEPFKVDYQHAIGMDASQISSEERFIEDHLNNPDVFLAVYKTFFKLPLAGNGIQILIFNDDENVKQFGHIICQYLSINFGVDIVFLDPKFRKNCRGYEFYQGNKELGKKTVKDVRDYEYLFDFNQAVEQAHYTGSLIGLQTYLAVYDFDELMYLYNLVFPNDPIPPGNYTPDHIREILIARTTVDIDKNAVMSNMLLQNWSSIVDRMDTENRDFGQDGGLW